MAKKRLEIGISNFKKIVANNNYFVDKTMLIYAWMSESAYVSLMPRPKRFGKTLNLSMIEHFFDIRKADSAKLFQEFKISEKKDFCKVHQNKYPVINVSLKGIKETTWEKCLEKFRGLVSKLYQEHDYLLDSDRLRNYEKQLIENIILKTANEAEYKDSLASLSNYLQKHFEEEVIILVDEYDAPIINAFHNTDPPIKSNSKENKTYYENIISFMQGFLGDAYKGNNSLKKGLLTGVMRVGRESIFSEWNNFAVYGITSPYFADNFGFSQKETEKIVAHFGLTDRMPDVQRWYNGYTFGDASHIYNPWSIVNYISREREGFKPYWVNSGDYSLIKSRILEIGVKENIQNLIEGKTIEKELKENFVFPDFETDNELLWTLLTDNGYLTQAGKAKYGSYKLRIPNNEIKIVFTDIVRTWLNQELKITRELLIETAECLINNQLEEFEKGFRQIIGDTLSYFDTAEKNSGTNEQIYHVYTLGLLTILSDDFMIKSNRESGEGRYDILLIPHDKAKNGIVIEIKTIEKQKETESDEKFRARINNSIENAVRQIERNEYYKELIINKIKPKNIIKLAIVFAGKEPYINKLK